MTIKGKELILILMAVVIVIGAIFSSTLYYFENKLNQAIETHNTETVVQKVIRTDDVHIQEVIEEAKGSIVSITTTRDVNSFFTGTYETESSGSGVVYQVEEKGVYVITNHHVVDQSKVIYLDFGLNDQKTAEIIGSDKEADLAILLVKSEEFEKNELEDISVAKLGNNKDLVPGEMAIAIGNSLGYGETVTVGVISAVDRSLGVTGSQLYSLIQTDAAINPGNSGGALLNAYGQVIGINTIKVADTRVEGVGFAIPISDALIIVDQLKKYGYLPKPYIGITGKSVEDDIAENYSVPKGVFIMEVLDNSPAKRANLMEKDIIISIDDLAVKSIEDLIKEVRRKKPGDTVSLRLIRNHQEIEVDLELGKMENDS